MRWPVNEVLFDRFVIPGEFRPLLGASARGVLLDLWDRSKGLSCACAEVDRVLRVKVFAVEASLMVQVSCWEHAVSMVSASVELRE